MFGRVITPMGPLMAVGASKWPPAGAMFAAIPPAGTKFAAFAPTSSVYGAFAIPGLGASDGVPPALRGVVPGLATTLPARGRR